MDKLQTIRVKGLAADITVVRVIEEISGKGVANLTHMDTDLVGPPRI